MNVRVHIDRVVLDGFDLDRANREALREALALALTERLVEGGLADRLGGGATVAALPSSTIAITPGAESRVVGAEVAGAIYGGIGR
jgi:hypothetical protein